MVKASMNPKNRQVSKTGTGLHFARIKAARAMNPRPAVIDFVKSDDCPVERYAPPAAASIPEIMTAVYRSLVTDTPAASAAAGFSPVAQRRSPKGVRYNTYQQIGTRAKASIEAIEMLLK